MHSVLPVAAAAPLASVLRGPVVAGRAAAVGRHAGYVVLPSGRVVAVATPEAVLPPCAVVLPRGHDPRDVLAPGSTVHVGAGGLRSDRGRLVVRRWWAPGVLPAGSPDPASVARAGRLLDPATGEVADAGRRRALAVASPAARALVVGDAARASALLVGVLGLGPGSTPSGDDVATGLLVGARAFGAAATTLDAVAAAVLHAAPARTTPVSRGLLAEAVAGRAVAPVLQLVRALLGEADTDRALARLLGLGHTSGADLAVGLVAASTAALHLTPAVTPRRRSA